MVPDSDASARSFGPSFEAVFEATRQERGPSAMSYDD